MHMRRFELWCAHTPSGGTFPSVIWRGGEVDTIFGFEKEADALQWIKEKSQGWLVEQNRAIG
jgi:hypothetical protein